MRLLAPLAIALLLASCAHAQQGVLRGRQVIIRNLTPPGTAVDLLIQNADSEARAQIGVATSDSGSLALHGPDGAVAFMGGEVGATMLGIRNDDLDLMMQSGISGSNDGFLTVHSDTGALTHIGAEPGATMLVVRNDALAIRFQAGIAGSDSGAIGLASSGGAVLGLGAELGTTMVIGRNNALAARFQLGIAGSDDGELSLFGDSPELNLGNTEFHDTATVDWDLFFPSAAPASTLCLEVSSSGQMQYAAAACGAGGGTPAGVHTEIQLNISGAFGTIPGLWHNGEALGLPRSAGSPSTEGGEIFFLGDTGVGIDYHLDVSGGDFRLYNITASDRTFQIFNNGAGDLNVVLEGDLNPSVDGQYALGIAGSTDLRWGLGAFDDIRTEDLLFQRQGQSSHDFALQNSSSNILQLLNSSGDIIIEFSELTPGINIDRNVWPRVNAAYDFGVASFRWNVVRAEHISAYTDVLPDVNLGADIGTSAGFFDEAYLDNIILGTNMLANSDFGVDIGAAGASAFDDIYARDLILGRSSSTTGSLTFHLATASGGATISSEAVTGNVDISVQDNMYPSAANTFNLGLATREWLNIYGSTIWATSNFRGPSGTAGASVTLSCGVGQAVKTLTTSGGVVTAATCGVP